jgi:hypothetical protein
MSSDKIIEGNKLLATFLGWKYFEWNNEDLKTFGDGFEKNKQKAGWRRPIAPFSTSSEIIARAFKESSFVCRKHTELRFYNNWNSLMEVVERIEKLHNEVHGRIGVHISSNCCTIQGTNLHKALADSYYGPVYFADHYADTKLQATWEACVEFVKWYNKNNLHFHDTI